LLVAPGEEEVATAVAQQAACTDHDFADFFGILEAAGSWRRSGNPGRT
jgi:hypothetical protein